MGQQSVWELCVCMYTLQKCITTRDKKTQCNIFTHIHVLVCNTAVAVESAVVDALLCCPVTVV